MYTGLIPTKIEKTVTTFLFGPKRHEVKGEWRMHNEEINDLCSSPNFFFLLALQPPLGIVFYSPLVGFSLLAYEVS